MAQILLVVGIFSVAVVAMALSLHFSKYKKRPSGCCGGQHCETNGAHHNDPEAHATHSCYNDKVNYLETLNKA